MSRSRVFLFFCLAFLGGVSLSSFVFIPQPILLGVLISGSIFIIFSFAGLLGRVSDLSQRLLMLGFCLLFLVAGAWRYQAVASRLNIKETEGQNINFLGVVSDEPALEKKRIKLKVSVEEESFKGKVLITSSRYPEYKYGDKLRIRGLLQLPPIFDDFNYRDYLKKEGVLWVMYYPEIEVLDSGFGNPLKGISISFKNGLKESLGRVMSIPQAGLMEALLFGEENNISEEWKQKLNLTGTRHIAAVSGMNITIITALLLNFFLYFGLWRHQAFWASLFLIFFYVLMIGAPASGIRAAIMGILFLTAQYFGRPQSGSRAMVLALCLMLGANPLLLRFDVGFQLSFLAVIGLFWLQPIFSEALSRVPQFFQLRYNLSCTLAAQVFTFPILVYNFGRVSTFSILPNILILPFLPLVTVLGFIFSFLGLVSSPLARILSWPAWLFLTYFLKVIDFFSNLPFVSLRLEDASSVWLFVSYLILGFMTWRLTEKQRLKFLDH